MIDNFFNKMNDLSDAVRNASPEAKEHIAFLDGAWDNAVMETRRAESRLISQYIDGYDPNGNSPLNVLLRENKDKMKSQVMWMIAASLKEAPHSFPYNFLEELRSIASAGAEGDERSISPEEMAAHVKAFHENPQKKGDFTIDEGISILEEQSTVILVRSLSRRLDKAYDMSTPGLTLVSA